MRDAVRPILLRNVDTEFTEFPFSFGGTCFVVGFDDIRLAVTCEHVAFQGVDVRFGRAASMTVPLRLDGRSGELAHFVELYHSPGPSGGSPEVGDVVCMELQADQAPRLDPYVRLPMPGQADIGPVVVGQKMAAFGYPMDVPILDYGSPRDDGQPAQRALSTRPWMLAGTFLRWDDPAQNIGVMALDGIFDDHDDPRAVGLNGFSGSPVFVRYPEGNSFGGMVISAGNGLVRFIRSRVISAMIGQLPIARYGEDA